MGILYVAPLFLPFLLLVAAEANGFRSNHDRWPTLSEVIKGWEDHRLAGRNTDYSASTTAPRQVRMVTVDEGGLPTWTWRRWAVALALPLAALVLELHLVWELF